MKILSVGNSFSTDAHRWLHAIARSVGDNDFEIRNLFIGGCSLARHHREYVENNSSYDYEINGNLAERKISLIDALTLEGEFDVITMQQTSRTCGQPQSYLPYLTELADVIRKNQPRAKLYFHETWAYETDAGNAAFAHYNHDQGEMFRRLCDCAEMSRLLIDCDLIRAGEFIQYLRGNVAEFNYSGGGRSLNRDGYHLSKNYGRFAAAAVWYFTLRGKLPNVEKFMEIAELREGEPEFDPEILRTIVSALEEFTRADEVKE